jgi:phage terminase Nu1 subunit (DNA packaging protein)
LEGIEMLVTRKQFAELKGVTTRTVQNWKIGGMIVHKNRMIDVEATEKRLAQYHVNAVAKEMSAERAEARRMRVAAEAQLLQLKLDARCRDLVSAEASATAMRAQCDRIRSAFMALGDNVAPRLSKIHETQAGKVKAIMDEEIIAILGRISARH